MKLTELYRQKRQTEGQISIIENAYRDNISSLNQTLSDISQKIRLTTAGLSIQRFERAERLIEVKENIRYDFEDHYPEECKYFFETFICALAGKEPLLKENYLAMVQREPEDDLTIKYLEFNVSPGSGSTQFSIRLRDPKKKLTDDEIEDCIYYLHNYEAYKNKKFLSE